MYSLGAIQKNTGEYILPKDAQKGIEYICMDCEQKVIFRKGVQRRAHFAHYSPTNTCSYYEHPNESQIHRDAKYRFASWLAQKKGIEFIGSCYSCKIQGCGCNTDGCRDKSGKLKYKIEYDNDDEPVVEYRDSSGAYIADVALVNNGVVKYIFEIQHTHKTTTDVRPEPWFEIDTEQFYKDLNDTDARFVFECVRYTPKRLCDVCKENKQKQEEAEERARKEAEERERISKIRKEIGPSLLKDIRENQKKCSKCSSYERCKKCSDKVFKLYNEKLRAHINPTKITVPVLTYRGGMEEKWKQEKPCIKCGRDNYSPYYMNGHRQICKICYGNNSDYIEFQIDSCIIED